ncbi:hypothetical protein EHP00_1711 [Ecytonucleospora hepatopenaei]|uniref:Uncharacterized protein n=1 Tax=Ecytonucleospora hepatopenaei TaxID=646526 RepID=A0A1W0E7H9_9MICR|nr:hypothetical protein EHP00_1711 [Ecytonucleospora hepatopenaei]
MLLLFYKLLYSVNVNNISDSCIEKCLENIKLVENAVDSSLKENDVHFENFKIKNTNFVQEISNCEPKNTYVVFFDNLYNDLSKTIVKYKYDIAEHFFRNLKNFFQHIKKVDLYERKEAFVFKKNYFPSEFIDKYIKIYKQKLKDYKFLFRKYMENNFDNLQKNTRNDLTLQKNILLAKLDQVECAWNITNQYFTELINNIFYNKKMSLFSKNKNNKNKIAYIIGFTVLAFVLLAIGIYLLFYFKKRNKNTLSPKKIIL